jgi:hypothetical protein
MCQGFRGENVKYTRCTRRNKLRRTISLSIHRPSNLSRGKGFGNERFRFRERLLSFCYIALNTASEGLKGKKEKRRPAEPLQYHSVAGLSL